MPLGLLNPSLFTLRSSLFVLHLLVVIRFTLDDSTCTIEGLGEDEAHHLVGESHLGEGNLLVGTAIDGIGEAVGTTDDEDESASRRLLALQPLGIFDASELLSVLIQQDDGVGWLDEFEDEFSLTLLLLLFAEALGVLELRDGSDGERHVVGDALGIILDASDEMLVDGLSDQNEFCLHDECLANIYILCT